jgi:hypothetical protein
MKKLIANIASAAALFAFPLSLRAETIKLQSPLDYQVVQRSSRAKGTITIAGSVLPEDKNDSPPDALEVSFIGKSQFGAIEETWRPIPFDPRVPAFRSQIVLPAGGWYRLQLRALRHNTPVATLEIPHVGIGEIFVISGQSNSANYGEGRQSPATGMVATFDGNSWRIANDPQPGAGGSGGSFVPAFGDAIARRFSVPVGIIATGVGATSVREWLPAGWPVSPLPTITHNVVTVGLNQWVSSGKIFDTFVGRIKPQGSKGFRAVLWHQGESDAHQADPGRTLPGPAWRCDMEMLIREANRAIGWDAPWFVARASYHNPGDTASPDVRAAQQALWDSGVAFEGPDTDTLVGEMRENGGKGVHMSAKGLAEHGRMWAEKVSPWLDLQIGAAPR